MFSIQKNKEAKFFNELTIHSRFVLFASLQTEIVSSSLFASLQILSRSGFIAEVLDTKNQRGSIFQRTDNSQPLRCICFFLNIIVKRFCFKFLDTKNQRGSIFQRTDIVPSLYLLCCKYYREALFFKCSRYKKLKRQNFQRTDNSRSLRCICFF